MSALRLTEKGYRVAVVEQGRWVTSEDMEQTARDPRRLFWIPALGMTGFFSQTIFRHLGVVGGVGVGGGSLVYAAVLLKPRPDFFADPAWSSLGVDWSKELAPHFETAARMLGVTANPHTDTMDSYLQQTAISMGTGPTFGPVPNGIYFGTPEVTQDDPFFDGSGPARTGCKLCGACLTGCPYGSKNSLDRNYLYLAERLGAEILSERKVTEIVPPEGGGYLIDMCRPVTRHRQPPPLRARNVILAAGVLGTLELLFRCREVTKSLPSLSPQQGKMVRTNSEAVVGILSQDLQEDLTRGATISSHFFPDPHTHITQSRRVFFHEMAYGTPGGRLPSVKTRPPHSPGFCDPSPAFHHVMAGSRLAPACERSNGEATPGQPHVIFLQTEPLFLISSPSSLCSSFGQSRSHLPSRGQ